MRKDVSIKAKRGVCNGLVLAILLFGAEFLNLCAGEHLLSGSICAVVVPEAATPELHNKTHRRSKVQRCLVQIFHWMYDLLTTNGTITGTDTPPLAKVWTVPMGAGAMKFYGGFSLGVFAPRQGKKMSCKADDQYSKKARGTTLQACFLECASDSKCENVFVDFVDIQWRETPPPVSCTLLGAVKDPSTACKEGTGTLINQLPGARSCAHLWDESAGESAPPAHGAPVVLPGPPSMACPL
jgi:hypothetical protein